MRTRKSHLGLALIIVLVVFAFVSAALVMTANQFVFAKRLGDQQWRTVQIEQLFASSLERSLASKDEDGQFLGDPWQGSVLGRVPLEFLITSRISEQTDTGKLVTIAIEIMGKEPERLERTYVMGKSGDEENY